MTVFNAELALDIFRSLVEDMEDLLEVSRGTLSNDYERIAISVKSRGLRIFLLDLPSLCSDLERSLDSGHYVPRIGAPFSSEGKPTIFGLLYGKIFTENWVLRPNACVLSVRLLRQAYKILKKYRIEAPHEATQEKIHEFLQIEDGLPQPRLTWGGDLLECRSGFPCLVDLGNHIYGISEDHLRDRWGEPGTDTSEQLALDLSAVQSLADKVFKTIDLARGTRTNAFWPKHGPGAVSEQFRNSKYEFPTWPLRLECMFPFDRYGLINHMDYEMEPPDSEFRSSPPAKLVGVPKDYKGPRLIASEPIAAQYIQQGILGILRKNVRDSLLRHCIDFRSQEPSRALALTASCDGSLSTIDLSSASDRLSCAVVECIFRKSFGFLELLNAARTPGILMPDGQILQQKKFAAQGAAFTFPIQSIIYAIICIGVISSDNRHMRFSDLARMVRVFGDDMIVPTRYFPRICLLLESVGLKVNQEKSFNKGLFRESCGMDAFSGSDVTPASVLQTFNPRDPVSLVSVVECSNNLYLKGFIRCSSTLLETIPKEKRLAIPFVRPGSTVMGVLGCGKSPLKTRYNKQLCRPEVRVLSVEMRVHKTIPDGRLRLFQWFNEKPLPESKWVPGEVKAVKARYRLRWVPREILVGY